MSCLQMHPRTGREPDRAATNVHKDPKGRLTAMVPIVFDRTHMIPLISGFVTEYLGI
jgi:hypothetical protein